MDVVTRRAILATLASGAAGVGGCATDDGTPDRETGDRGTTTDDDPTETLSMGETATAPDGSTLAVADPAVRKIVETPDVGGGVHAVPTGAADRQFVVVGVDEVGRDGEALALSLDVDGTWRDEDPYRLGIGPGGPTQLAFHVPIVDVASAAVEWRPTSDAIYRWPLPTDVVDALAWSPEFVLETFDVPDSLPRGEALTGSLAVANEGDRTGRFLAVLFDQGPSSVPLATVRASIEPGERVSRDFGGRSVDGDRSTLTTVLDWGIDRREVAISIRD